jgi:hypothetical protein
MGVFGSPCFFNSYHSNVWTYASSVKYRLFTKIIAQIEIILRDKFIKPNQSIINIRTPYSQPYDQYSLHYFFLRRGGPYFRYQGNTDNKEEKSINSC